MGRGAGPGLAPSPVQIWIDGPGLNHRRGEGLLFPLYCTSAAAGEGGSYLTWVLGPKSSVCTVLLSNIFPCSSQWVLLILSPFLC